MRRTAFYFSFLCFLLLSTTLNAAECIPDLGNGNICTAKDFVLSEVLISGPADCTEGEIISQTITIRVGIEPTANERYDIGFFVGDHGESPIQGASCTFSSLVPLENSGNFGGSSGSGPYRDLDSNQCGDTLKTDGVVFRDMVLNDVLCQDSDNDGKLDISYALTWQQQQVSCNDPLDPANFFPPTSSKCIAGIGNLEDVEVTPPPQLPSIIVHKNVFPKVLKSPGGNVFYSLTIENNGTEVVTLTLLQDDIFGSIDGNGSCSLPQQLEPQESYSCIFPKNIFGDAGTTHTNTITATAEDSDANLAGDSDNATVLFVAPIEPTASIGDLVWNDLNGDGVHSSDEPGLEGIDVTLSTNSGSGYAVTDTTTTSADGHYAFTALPSGAYRITPDTSTPPLNHMIHTGGLLPHDVTLGDDEHYPHADFGFSQASITVMKTVDRTMVSAPSATVNYTVTVQNDGAVEVTLTHLYDLPFGDLTDKGCSLPQTLLSGDSFTCTFSETITGNPGDKHTNTVIALAWDQDQTPVYGADSASVIFKTFPWSIFIPPTVPKCPPVPDYCYIVADSDNFNFVNSPLFKYIFKTDTLELVNQLGVTNVETMTISLDGKTVYAVDGAILGIIDPTPGISHSFTPIAPTGIGSGNGAYGEVTFKDIDGLAFDPPTGILYGTERYKEQIPTLLDLLIQINPATGKITKNAFGQGIDYVIIDTQVAGVKDADDIDIDASGRLYGVAGISGGGGDDQGVIIDKQTGSVSLFAPLLSPDGIPVQDMEGLTLYNLRDFYGTTGIEFAHQGTDNTLYRIDKTSGKTEAITRLDRNFDGYVPSDFEAISCFPVCEQK